MMWKQQRFIMSVILFLLTLTPFCNARRHRLRNYFHKRSNNNKASSSGETRIVGGQPATAADGLDYIVDWFKCGASLIHSDILLSAAHCDAIPERNVRIGGVAYQDATAETRTIVSRHVHPLYDISKLSFDFLILQLNEAVRTKMGTIILRMLYSIMDSHQFRSELFCYLLVYVYVYVYVFVYFLVQQNSHFHQYKCESSTSQSNTHSNGIRCDPRRQSIHE